MKRIILAVMSVFIAFIAVFAAYTYLDGSYNKTNAHNAHIDVSEFVKSAEYAFEGLADHTEATNLFEQFNDIFNKTQFLDSDWGIGGIKQLINQPSDATGNPFAIVNRAAKIVVGLIGNVLIAPITLLASIGAVVWWLCIYFGQFALLAFNLLSGGFIIFT